ncbi:hypothetical protein AQUCO_00300874v1 [Aquilegia coerulea]|uniref:Uncharacterized protein n=1 Tax=Aquilegia coerulea TaxID=218851 RepID=A0A2G5F0Z6_AQUCA|nr:hypothetical protein AQUCO_00300874v1 [Aquilegia coerulea]
MYLVTITTEMFYIKHMVTNFGLNTWAFVFLYNIMLSLMMALLFWFVTFFFCFGCTFGQLFRTWHFLCSVFVLRIWVSY